ncbi:MAG: hypothetical protein L3J66_04175 [Bacteroidales bacterium]|nr:hypothetical protein [Bacteroidales bacterium]
MYSFKKLYYYPLFTLFLFSTLFLESCYKFSGSQTVPAYLKIDSVFIETNYSQQGSNSSKITDVWIYLNKDLVGVFELPALFPVLADGINDLEIRPGIWLNGISSTRVPYPFYKPVVYSQFNFVPDSVHNLGMLTTGYYDNLEFAWLEDFEQSGRTLIETGVSDTAIKQTQPENNPEAFLTANSKHSGLISLTEEKPIYSGISLNSFSLPKQQNDPVLLELNFKTDNLFNVGLLMNVNGSIKKIPLLIMKHTEQWNKIYINLGPNIGLNSNAFDYKVYFESGLEPDNDLAQIYLDNIKLIYRKE